MTRLADAMIPDIDRVTQTEYLDNLSDRSIDELRAMRAECNNLENATSYVRRFAQARVDMLANMNAVTDIDDLPEALIGHESEPVVVSDSQPQSYARPIRDFEPDSAAELLLDELDMTAPLGSFVAAEDDPQLAADLLTRLSEFERSISHHRRQLHEIIDTVQREVVRRYRNGEVSVDRLLAE